MISLQIFCIVDISISNILIRINMVSPFAPWHGHVVDLYTHMSVTTWRDRSVFWGLSCRTSACFTLCMHLLQPLGSCQSKLRSVGRLTKLLRVNKCSVIRLGRVWSFGYCFYNVMNIKTTAIIPLRPALNYTYCHLTNHGSTNFDVGWGLRFIYIHYTLYICERN